MVSSQGAKIHEVPIRVQTPRHDRLDGVLISVIRRLYDSADADSKGAWIQFRIILTEIFLQVTYLFVLCGTVWSRLVVRALTKIHIVSQVGTITARYLADLVVKGFEHLGLIKSVALVRKTPYVVLKQESSLSELSKSGSMSVIIDAGSWSSTRALIRTVLQLSECGYRPLGNTTPRYCFSISDSRAANPFVVITSLLLSISFCLEYVLVHRRLPRQFPLFHDFPPSKKISSIEEVTTQ